MSTHAGRCGTLGIKKEVSHGTYIAADFPLRITSESIGATQDQTEDPALIGQRFTYDLIKMGVKVAGNIEFTSIHPEELGPCLFWGLGGETAVTDPVAGYLVVWYTGAVAYWRLTRATGTLVAETSTDGSSWSADNNFGTGGTLDTTAAASDTLGEIAALINGYTGYDATHFGLSTKAATGLANFAATQGKTAGVSRGAFVMRFATAASTTAKTHTLTPVASTGSLPSNSITTNKTLGTNKSLGYTGCKCGTIGITVTPKEGVKISLGITGKTEEVDQTDVTYTLPTTIMLKAANCKFWIDNVEAVWSKDLTINYNNNLEISNRIGSLYVEEPVPQGSSIECSTTAQLDATTSTGSYQFRTDFLNNTHVEWLLYLEGDDYCDSTNTIKYSALIRINRIKLSDAPVSLTTADRLQIPLTGKAISSGYSWYNVIETDVTDNDITTY